MLARTSPPVAWLLFAFFGFLFGAPPTGASAQSPGAPPQATGAVFTSKPELLQERGAGEGPAWHPELGLLTSGGDGHVYRRDRSGAVTIHRRDAGSNGLMFDRQARLIICEPVRRRVSRIEPDGATTVLAETYDGRRFNQPNDLALDSKNRIYFSDPRYGDRSGMELRDAAGRAIEGVYRIDVDGRVVRVITHEVDRPNGLVVTADDRYLFVADNNNSQGGARKLWRFELRDDGAVALDTRTLIHDWKTTRGPDGMKLDAAGRLYVAAGLNKPNPPHETADPPTAGVYVFSADGKLLDFAPIPRDETTNCAFGGDDLKSLYVTAGGSLWRIGTATAGRSVWPAAKMSKSTAAVPDKPAPAGDLQAKAAPAKTTPAKPAAKPAVAPKAAAAPPPVAPADVLDPRQWTVADLRGNTFAEASDNGRSTIAASGRSLLIVSPEPLVADSRIRLQFRLADPAARGGVAMAVGLAAAADLKEKGAYFSVTPSGQSVGWSVFDPKSTARTPETRGAYRPQFHVERSLAWPELLRANVEADMVASRPLAERLLTFDVTLREHGYDVQLDGIPLTSVADPSIRTAGFARLVVSPGVQLVRAAIDRVAPVDDRWTFRTVSLGSILNAGRIDGRTLDRSSLPGISAAGPTRAGRLEVAGVPFELDVANSAGHDHLDVGASWFRQGNVTGRYSGRGPDAMTARWPGAMLQDPARLTLRLPMARYRALHLLAAADSDSDQTPVITAQFYRAQAGFPKNFAARVPAFTSTAADALPVRSTDGRVGRLFHVTIPIDGGALAEFDDLDYVDVELTKQVQLYRASPDPMYYSQHAAGLPSSVHVYALTAERPSIDLSLAADAYGHIWTAPETPTYTATLRNRRGPPRAVKVELVATSLDGLDTLRRSEQVALTDDRPASIVFPLAPRRFGHYEVALTVSDGGQTLVERRSLAYLRGDTRQRGDWDFGRGPLFGFWNWGGGHHTPSAARQLLVMAKAGIESTPGSFEEYTARHGEEARKVMEQYKLITLKFAGAGDHYVTARFAGDLKKEGLEKARETFVKTLRERSSKPGPNSRPMFLSFYPEPSIGPTTHGIFPHFIGEPEQQFSDSERERYELFLNGFVEGAKIVKQHFPDVKCLLPHGDPAFVIHFLRRNPEVAKLLDGVTVDIPCFERLPEQQFHQVSLHRMYMSRKEMADAGVKNPLLPMYEGPCVPSGPGALTDAEHSDLTIRNSLLLLVYGVTIQNGGFPAFDTASYWGEQHYGFGVLNRVSLETPKPAYSALATLTRHLNRANYKKWIPTGSHNVYALQFQHYRTGKKVHVFWTLRGKRPVTIDLPAGALSGGARPVLFDQMDNQAPLSISSDAANGGAKATFTIDQSPCYLEGLEIDPRITLGAPDHGDSRPADGSRRVASLGDGSWSLAVRKEKEYEESHTPYIFRFPSPMTAEAIDSPTATSNGSAVAPGGRALAVRFPAPEKDRVFVPYYSVLAPRKPIAIAGKASHLGLWVRANGDWGRVVYFLRDAKGEQWISVGTRGAWNCDDLHSWSSFNFDGWRYLRMELPANSPYDQYREAGNAWWGPYSSGDGNVDLPLQLEKIVVERRTHVMYVDDPQPADRGDVLLGDLYAEYAAAADATPEAVRLSAIRMPTPRDVPGLTNPIAALRADGVGPAVAIERITLPAQEADGTQCYVHFPKVAGARQYDVWASPYPDGRGALQLGKAWKEPGLLVRGLRPNQNFWLFATYQDADGKTSAPSAPFKIHLEDFFGMK